MNYTKMYKHFNLQALEATIASLVSVNRTEIRVKYVAFDKSASCHVTNCEDYIVNMYPYHNHLGQKSSSIRQAVNKIMTAHPSAYLQGVEFDIYCERVEITFYDG